MLEMGQRDFGGAVFQIAANFLLGLDGTEFC